MILNASLLKIHSLSQKWDAIAFSVKDFVLKIIALFERSIAILRGLFSIQSNHQSYTLYENPIRDPKLQDTFNFQMQRLSELSLRSASLTLRESDLRALLNEKGFFTFEGPHFLQKAKDLGSGFQTHLIIDDLFIFTQLSRDLIRTPVAVISPHGRILKLIRDYEKRGFISDIQKIKAFMLQYLQGSHASKIVEISINMIQQATLSDANRFMLNVLRLKQLIQTQKLNMHPLTIQLQDDHAFISQEVVYDIKSINGRLLNPMQESSIKFFCKISVENS